MIYFFFVFLILAFVIYTMIKMLRNKKLSIYEKIYWFAIILCFPFLGAVTYLRTNFKEFRI